MQKLGAALVSISEHPYTRIIVGVALLISGFDDLLEGITGNEGAVDIDLHHGILIFALQHMTHAVGDLFEGLKRTGHHLAGGSGD